MIRHDDEPRQAQLLGEAGLHRARGLLPHLLHLSRPWHQHQYNLFDLFGNQDQQQQQATRRPIRRQQIASAEKDQEKDPKDPGEDKDLAALYYTAGRYDDAIQVLQRGQEVAPKDEEIQPS